MTCPECAATNPKGALFCEHCGAALTASAVTMLRRKELSEKRARELELTEAVSTRLLKWTKTFLFFAGLLFAGFGVVLGKGCSDTQKAVETGQTQINEAVISGKEKIQQSVEIANSNVSSLQKRLAEIGVQSNKVQQDVTKYQTVNEHIAKLQSDLTRLQGEVIDLGHKTLKVEKLETTGKTGGELGFGITGCPVEKAKGSLVTYCAQGSPLALNQLTPDGQVRPVASFSNEGFQDISHMPRGTCSERLRGTLYVEKGATHRADRAYLCVKDDADNYGWLQITTTK